MVEDTNSKLVDVKVSALVVTVEPSIEEVIQSTVRLRVLVDPISELAMDD